MSTYAFVAYPLSAGFHEQIRELADDGLELISIADIRQRPAREAVGMLHRLEPEAVVVPLEDAGSTVLLPLLGLLASIPKARRRLVIYPDMRVRSFSRWTALAWGVGAAAATMKNVVAALLAYVELVRLLKVPRQAFSMRGGGDWLYLKTNMWFGLKAGGSVGHTAGVLNELVRREPGRVTFVSPERPIMVEDGLNWARTEPPSHFGVPAELNLYAFQRSFVRQLPERRANTHISAIYHRLSLGSYAGVVASRKFCAPLILEYNGSEVWVARNWGRPLRFERLASMAEEACLRHATAIVTVSEALKDELVSRGVDESRIVMYPNCVDPRVFDPSRFTEEETSSLRMAHGASKEATVVSFLGTFGPWHGAEVFAQAIVELAEERGVLERLDLRFWFVGDGARRGAVEQTLAGHPASRYVTMTGLVPQTEAPLFLAASDIVVSPHVRNTDGTAFFGSPTKLFEYMAMGKAIVASRLDQIETVLQGSPSWPRAESLGGLTPESKALFVEPGDASQLAGAIQALARRPEWRRTLGDRARLEVMERYLWRHHVDAIFRRLTDD